MTQSKIVNLLSELNTLSDAQMSQVLSYTKRIKYIKSIARPTSKSLAMKEIRNALKQEYSF